MGKKILHEHTYDSVDGHSLDTNALEYSKVTSCLTVTCICTDGTIAGGHIVIIPFCMWYVTSNLKKRIKNKIVSTVCLVGSEVWDNTDQLKDLLNQKTDELYYPDDRGGNVAFERYYLADVIANGGESQGLETAVSAILERSDLNFYTSLYDGELTILFQGEKDRAKLFINNKEIMEFIYAS